MSFLHSEGKTRLTIVEDTECCLLYTSLTLTTDFLGGLFSLDGLHPTNTGYAIMANRFIETMNASFRRNIPLADVQQIAATDPLLP